MVSCLDSHLADLYKNMERVMGIEPTFRVQWFSVVQSGRFNWK
jgi:hypothetical protein